MRKTYDLRGTSPLRENIRTGQGVSFLCRCHPSSVSQVHSNRICCDTSCSVMLSSVNTLRDNRDRNGRGKGRNGLPKRFYLNKRSFHNTYPHTHSLFSSAPCLLVEFSRPSLLGRSTNPALKECSSKFCKQCRSRYVLHILRKRHVVMTRLVFISTSKLPT